MLIEVSHLAGIPVAALDTESMVGTVEDTVLHPHTGELVGFWVKPAGWFAAKRALSARDIVGYEERGLLVRTGDVLVAADEIQPFTSISRQPDRWLGKPVETAEGERLGTVADVVLDTDLERVAKLHVAKLFGAARIIDRDQISKITPTRIIVTKNLESKAVSTAAIATEAA